MSTIIKLPAGTEKILFSDISSLLAKALFKTEPLLLHIEKRDNSSDESVPLDKADIKLLKQIWRQRNRIKNLHLCSKANWIKYEDDFNNAENKPSWSLVPIWEEFPNVIEEKILQQQLISDAGFNDDLIVAGNVKHKFRLVVYDKNNNQTKDRQKASFVTIDDFIKYARHKLCEVLLEGEPEAKDFNLPNKTKGQNTEWTFAGLEAVYKYHQNEKVTKRNSSFKKATAEYFGVSTKRIEQLLRMYDEKKPNNLGLIVNQMLGSSSPKK